MTERNLALPGNPRYQPKSLQPIFGYDNLYVPVGEVELATLDTLGEFGVIPASAMALLAPEVRRNVLDIITTTEVDGVERKITGHDIRAWVRIAQESIPKPLRPWLHIPLTSYDPLDTARALQFARAHQKVVRSEVKLVVETFTGLVTKFAHTLQVGRTHGQHALPITVGFWLATILSRILYNAREMDRFAAGLVGKISGAVGAHNAQVAFGFIPVGVGDPKSFEERVLEKLGLKPAPISTQILPPEPLAYYLYACTMLTATFGQFGTDGRQLMRTEIAELAEEFEEGQVGSSTMPHKRNPVTFEGLVGAWLKTKHEFGKVFETLVSEHQRDLTGSSVMRDFPVIVVNLVHQLESLLRRSKGKDGKEGKRFLERITVSEEACRRNFEMSRNVILSEPIYIALQMGGYAGDAHELVNHRAMPISQTARIPLIEAVELIAPEDPAVKEALERIPAEIRGLLGKPEEYTGDATEKALEIAADALRYIGN